MYYYYYLLVLVHGLTGKVNIKTWADFYCAQISVGLHGERKQTVKYINTCTSKNIPFYLFALDIVK